MTIVTSKHMMKAIWQEGSVQKIKREMEELNVILLKSWAIRIMSI